MVNQASWHRYPESMVIFPRASRMVIQGRAKGWCLEDANIETNTSKTLPGSSWLSSKTWYLSPSKTLLGGHCDFWEEPLSQLLRLEPRIERSAAKQCQNHGVPATRLRLVQREVCSRSALPSWGWSYQPKLCELVVVSRYWTMEIDRHVQSCRYSILIHNVYYVLLCTEYFRIF